MVNQSMNTTKQLADFVSSVRFDDLTEEVIEYTKMIILDTLICGIAAGSMERSRMLQRIVQHQKGVPEATVFGLHEKYPAPLAVMANAEMMNALDADDTFFSSSHFAAFNVAAALAEAQRNGSGGREMILGVVTGFDVNARLNLASQVFVESEDGTVRWSRVMGMGFASFGTAVTAAKIRKLDSEKVRNLFGLLNSFAPTPTVNAMTSSRVLKSFKYANYPAVAHAGMLALEFADIGYVADQDCLDGDGFLLAQGCLGADEELLLDELGSKWWILETAVKYYPSCRYTHGAIDLLRKLMAEEDLTPDLIERIEVGMNPMALAHQLFREPARSIEFNHYAPFNGQFNIPYVLALAALGVRPGPVWYAQETMSDSRIWSLANRIFTAEDPLAREEVNRSREIRIKRFRKSPASITVWARGKKFERRCDYVSGDPWSPETRVTWDDLETKLNNFCEGILSDGAMRELVQVARNLDQVDNVREAIQVR